MTVHVHVVRRGETLSIIARRHGSSVAVLARQNGIRNINLIHVGQRISVPSTVRRPVVAVRPSAPVAGGGTRLAAGALTLSAADVLNIKKTTQTEWI
jgi:LysM repeat protein